jgi:hypothetical protein
MNPLSAAFGVLMVVTAAGSAGSAVAVGVVDRRAAPAAVLLTITALALSDPGPLFAAVSGMAAAVYLLTRHAAATGAITLTAPTVAGLLGFTAVGLVGTAVALPVNWTPLLTPVIMAAVLVVAALPLLADDRTGAVLNPGAEGEPPD